MSNKNCVICDRSGDELCSKCDKLEWRDKILLMRLKEIVVQLATIEQKIKDRNGW